MAGWRACGVVANAPGARPGGNVSNGCGAVRVLALGRPYGRAVGHRSSQGGVGVAGLVTSEALGNRGTGGTGGECPGGRPATPWGTHGWHPWF